MRRSYAPTNKRKGADASGLENNLRGLKKQSVKKIIKINPYMLGTMAGGAADCQFWHRNLGIKGYTIAPDYLSESELISLMEKHGIGTDASISVHINNICERNYVQVQGGRKLVPTALGICLIRRYQCIDPDLCLPDIRSFIEHQITLVAKGQADHSRVVQHVLLQFKQKYGYFVKQIENMDALFEAQFSPLADSGRVLSRCGKCLRYMKYISTQPSRLFCGTCEEVYYVPKKVLSRVVG
ncbi:unnamed protein product [Rhodiola kirilowii]